METDFTISKFADPNKIFNGKILILVPHMDDEILACGGTIALLNNKDLIHFVFATDGKRSPSSKDSNKVDLNKIRTDESKTALGLLGIPERNIRFLNLPEGRLQNYSVILEEKLSSLIKELKPNFIFIPFHYDKHPDHLALNKSSIKAYLKANLVAQLFEYFVYTQWQLLKNKDIRKYIKPELLINIDTRDSAEIKREALNCFESQTTIYFETQNRPVLTSSFLKDNCQLPEVFLRTNIDSSESVFTSSSVWISFVHFIEPRLKVKKDKLLSILYSVKNAY